jgi:hypothetical protein
MKTFYSDMLGMLGMVCLTLSIALAPAKAYSDVGQPVITIANHCGAPAGLPPNSSCPAPNAHCLKDIAGQGAITYPCANLEIDHPVTGKKGLCLCMLVNDWRRCCRSVLCLQRRYFF